MVDLASIRWLFAALSGWLNDHQQDVIAYLIEENGRCGVSSPAGDCADGCALTAADDGVLIGHRVLICDRDGKWTSSVRQLLGRSGIRVVQTPFQAPNANAYVERFVRRSKMSVLGE